LYGKCLISFYTFGSLNCLPINLLVAKRVLSGLVTAYLLAGAPTKREPSVENETIEGVVL